MKWLLDTNVVSEHVRPYPDRSVVAWLTQRSLDQTAISIVTLAELRVGAFAADNKGRRLELTTWVEDEIVNSFAGRILPLTAEILVDWLQLGRNIAAKGKTRSPADLLIASTARFHDLIVVSRNAQDFAGTGVILYDPWTGKIHHLDTA